MCVCLPVCRSVCLSTHQLSIIDLWAKPFTYLESAGSCVWGTLPETNEIVIHIYSCHNIFFPFFCANTFYTSLLLIVCALKLYIKSLYRHLFLEDISKHARVTQKKNFLICGKLYRQALWPQRAKLGVRVAKALSCDTAVLFILSGEPPPLSYSVEKRRDPKKSRNFFGPASSQHYNSGGVHRKKRMLPIPPVTTKQPTIPLIVPEG